MNLKERVARTVETPDPTEAELSDARLHLLRTKSSLLALAMVMVCASGVARATDYTWDIAAGNSAIDDGSGTWDTNTAGWTSDGGANNVVWPNTTNDAAIFNGSTGGAVTVSGNFSAGGISFSGAGANSYILSGSGGPTLTLGAGGITVNSAAGAQTLDSTLALSLSASQSWTNDSAGLLTIDSAASAAGAATLTVSGAGNTSLGGILADGAGALGLTKDGAGTLTLSAANTHSGATTVSNGTLTVTTGTVATLNVPAGTASLNGPAAATAANVGGGQLNLNGTVTTLTLTAGMVTVGSGATVGTADFSATTGTVNASNPLTITNRALLDGGTSITLGGGGTSFTLGGADVINPTPGSHRTVTASGGTLTCEGPYPTAGLIGRWTFDDGTANDSSGHGYHGTPVGSPAFSTNTRNGMGQCLVLNGNAQYVQVDTGAFDGNTQSTFDGKTNITISAWVKGFPAGQWNPYVSKYGENGYGWQHRRNNGNNVCWTTRGTSNQDMAGDNLNNTAWHMVTMTYDGANKKIYVDGAWRQTAGCTGTVTPTGAMLLFGARQNGNTKTSGIGNYYNGSLDDIYFYNRALTDAEVTLLYNYYTVPSNVDWSTTDLAAANTSAVSLFPGVTKLGALSLSNPGTQLTLGGAGGSAVAGFDNIAVADTSSIAGSLPISLRSGNVTVPSPKTLTLNPAIVDDTPAAPLNKLGDGTLTLTGSSTYSAGTIITAGTLQIGSGGTAGSIASDSAHTIVNNGVLAFDRSDTVSYVNPIGGTGSVHQIGAGSVILAGANTYTGDTVISSGKLYLNGANDTPTISVAAGATLGGSGSAPSAIATLAGAGIVEPGPGGFSTLALGGLAFSGTGTVHVTGMGTYRVRPAIDVLNSDGLTVDGGEGSVTIALIGLAPFGIGTAHVIHYAGTIGGSGAGFDAFELDTSAFRGAAHARFTLADRTDYVDVDYAVDHVVWTGAGGGNWTNSPAIDPVDPTTNWRLASSPSNTANFLSNDVVVFDDSASGTTVTISEAYVAPALVTFSNSTKDFTLQGAFGITGSTALAKNGAGTLTITANNSYNGGTTISGGTLQVGAGGASGTLGSGAVVNDAVLAFGGAGVVTVANAISGTGSVIQKGPGTLALAGPNSYGGGTTIDAGTLSVGSATALGATAGALTINGGALDSSVASLVLINNNPQVWNTANVVFAGSQSLNLGSGAVTLGSTTGVYRVTVSNNTLAVGGVISGDSATNLTKNGDGTLVLSGDNTNSATTIVSAGTLQAGSATAFGSAANANLVFGPGSTGRVQLYSNNVSFIGLNTDPVTAGTPILENGYGSGGITLTVSNATDNTFAGTLQDGAAGTLALVKQGAGKLTLQGTNTYSGGTTINGGTLSFSSSLPTAIVTFGNGSAGVLEYTGSGALAGSYYLVGTAWDPLYGTVKVTDPNGSITANRGWSANYWTLNKTGPGTLTLANGNSDAGGLIVSQGTVILAGTSSRYDWYDNTTGINDVKPGATLKMGNNNAGNIPPWNNSFTMSGGTFDVNGFAVQGAAPTISGSGMVTNSSATAGSMPFNAYGAVTFSGNIAGNLGISLVSGNGSWTLSGSNTYSGATTVNSGKLQAGSTNAFSPNSAFTLGNNCSLNLAGFDNSIAGLAGSGTVSNSVGQAILTVNNDAAGYAFGGVLQDGGGTLGLAKAGSMTLTLSGTNTYTGPTAISAGVLRLTHDQCLSTNTDVSIALGAKCDLAFTGTNTIRTLWVNGAQPPGAIFNAGNLRRYLTGTGNLRVANPSFAYSGTVILVK